MQNYVSNGLRALGASVLALSVIAPVHAQIVRLKEGNYQLGNESCTVTNLGKSLNNVQSVICKDIHKMGIVERNVIDGKLVAVKLSYPSGDTALWSVVPAEAYDRISKHRRTESEGNSIRRLGYIRDGSDEFNQERYTLEAQIERVVKEENRIQ